MARRWGQGLGMDESLSLTRTHTLTGARRHRLGEENQNPGVRTTRHRSETMNLAKVHPSLTNPQPLLIWLGPFCSDVWLVDKLKLETSQNREVPSRLT